MVFVMQHFNRGKFNASVAKGAVVEFPQCNTMKSDTWDPKRCWVIKHSNMNTTCACKSKSVTTTAAPVGNGLPLSKEDIYSMSADDFIPSVNLFFSVEDFMKITLNNLRRYPTGWAVIVTLLCGLALGMYLQKDNPFDHPILAYQHGLDHGTLLTLSDHDAILKRVLIKEAHCSYPERYRNLLEYNLRNTHPLLSMVYRDDGTNITGDQLVALFVTELSTIFCVAALFYGQTSSTATGDIMMSVYTALFVMIPMKALQFFWAKARPGEVDSKSAMFKEHKERLKAIRADDPSGTSAEKDLLVILKDTDGQDPGISADTDEELPIKTHTPDGSEYPSLPSTPLDTPIKKDLATEPVKCHKCQIPTTTGHQWQEIC